MGQTSTSNFSRQIAQNLIQADQEEMSHPYFQDYTLFKSRKLYKTNAIRKIIILNDSNQLKNMINSLQQIDKKPFNILYPYFVASWIGQETEYSLINTVHFKNICHQNSVAAVYFPEFTKNLVDFCTADNILQLSGKKKGSAKNSLRNTFSSGSKKKSINIEKKSKHDGLSQTTIWFILNQITRSLQLLHKKNHAHWCIMPQTIFFNEHQNWFIHDSYYVFGHNYQSFLQYKIKKKGMIISPDIRYKIEKNTFVDLSSGASQDVYCLGFVVLYMMGINEDIGNFDIRNKISRQISNGKILFKNQYSQSLLKTVQSMIAIHQTRRINIDRLRGKLKPLQAQIISRQVDDKIRFSKTNNTNSLDHLHTPTKTFNNDHRSKTNNFSRSYNGKIREEIKHQRIQYHHDNSYNTRLKTDHALDSKQRALQPYISNERFKQYLTNLNHIRQNKQVQARRWKSPPNNQPKNIHFRSVAYP